MLTEAQRGADRDRCLVIGHPVRHSLSPVIHRAAYAALGLDRDYEAVDVPTDGLGAFMADLDDRVRGLSVTMPHKAELVGHGTPDELVRQTGVANTWVPTGSGPIVRNTDVLGYAEAFASIGLTAAPEAVLVGNGATATSALVGLHRLGLRRVTLLVRDPARATALVGLAAELSIDARVAPLDGWEPAAAPASVMVSTVPVAGSGPRAEQLAEAAEVVFDSVYDPWPTPLAQAAAQRGRAVLNGLDLLAGQAVEQVRLMTGERVGFALLRSAAADAIGTPSTL